MKTEPESLATVQNDARPASAGAISDRDVRSEKLYTLWRLATQRHVDDDERIRAILKESCQVLGMDVAIVGKVDDGRYEVYQVHDPMGRFGPGQDMELSATPCQLVYELRESLFIEDLLDNRQTAGMPIVCMLKMQVYVGTPVWAGDRLWGVLAFTGTRRLDAGRADENITFLELVAAWLGQLLVQSEQREILQKQALTDQLTRLPNRRAAEQRLRNEMAQARRHEQNFTLALCDLDHFKLINDRYGHEVGDEVLSSVADLFQSVLREEDWVARWGGEEFLFFIRARDLTDGTTVADRLRESLSAHEFFTRAGKLNVTMSAGVATFDGRQDSLHQVLAEVDNCLYEAKRAGRDRVMSGKTIPSTLRIASELRLASKERRVKVAYQPIVDLKDDFRPVADEALARVETHDGTILAAGDFIQAAEGLHLMHEIDLEVNRQVFQRCVTMLNDGSLTPGYSHFVNLSPQFLARRNMIDEMLKSAVENCQSCSIVLGPVKPVVFEITERQSLHNLQDVLEELRPLLDFGFRLALDDFGSGYSSLLYLAKLPVSFIKIDGWLIRTMLEESKSRSLVRSLVAMAREQDIRTIAESVENEATARLCQELGVDWAQGYYFGYPEM